ncbi:hypothetical protein Tco_0311682, partial [Tanacetum coccineum]
MRFRGFPRRCSLLIFLNNHVPRTYGMLASNMVFDVERLVSNLCTMWIGRHRIHANVARFQRATVYNSSKQFNHNGEKRNIINEDKKDIGLKDNYNSYVHAVKGSSQVNREVDNNTALVLDESCVNQHDYSCCLNGKVKDFGSVSNLKVVLGNEGFDNIKLILGRIMGKAYWVRAKEVPGWILDLVEQNNKDSESDDEHSEGDFKEDLVRTDEELEGENEVNVVPDTVFEEETPKSNRDNYKDSSTNDSLKYPPGFTPSEDVEDDFQKPNQGNISVSENGEEREVSDDLNSGSKNNWSMKDGTESVVSGHFKKVESPRTGGSILILMDELIKVGQTMGYNMDGCMKNIEEIIESQGV